MKPFPFVFIHYIVREEIRCNMLIVQFPTIVFGPSLKQVKYWDTNKEIKWNKGNDWLYMRNFSNHDIIIMDSNENMMEWWN